MIEVYHYTTVSGLYNIIRSGALKKGRILGRTADSDCDLAVSLTFDRSPVGHGLPDSSQLTQEEAKLIPHEIKDGSPYSFDHRQIRIVIDFDMIKGKCIKASAHHEPDLFWQMQITAYYPNRHPSLLNEMDVKKQLFRFSEGLDRAKGSTWIYSLEEIPVVYFDAVDVLQESSEYPIYARYELEAVIDRLLNARDR